MTTEKLQEANKLLARIEKAKEVKTIIDQEGCVSFVCSDISVDVADQNLRECISDALASHIDKLEYDFKWL